MLRRAWQDQSPGARSQLTPVNGYHGLDLFAYLAGVCTASMAGLAVPQLLPASA